MTNERTLNILLNYTIHENIKPDRIKCVVFIKHEIGRVMYAVIK